MPSPFMGTFGAFIRVRSPIFSKRVLFDIGVAGPLAGFVFLLPALAVGLAFSKVIPGIAPPGQHGSSAFRPCSGCCEPPSFPGIRVGDIYLHPVARAAWVGMFATAMNLLPIGQLDGGHILYSFFPARHRVVQPGDLPAAAAAGHLLVCAGSSGRSILWCLGRRHPAIYDPPNSDAGRGSNWAGWRSSVFILCFTYAPIRRRRTLPL